MNNDAIDFIEINNYCKNTFESFEKKKKNFTINNVQ